jgi:Na+:H+ antiporter, NhaA family
MNPRRPVRRAIEASTKLFSHEVAGGVVLMAAAVVALVWANVAPETYTAVWNTTLTVGVPPVALAKPLLLWVNDALMAVFFVLVGLEIKRELLRGELASVRQALLPVTAALGGMLAPALIYALFNAGGPAARGWGIPMATDIAFALGALALLGDRVPSSLRVFLTAVAIADDVGAIVVIALFYVNALAWIALGLAGACVAALIALNRAGVERPAPYVLLGVGLWVAVLESGIHATIAGVVLAFTIPSGSRAAKPSLLGRLEHALGPWVSFAIMPLFALANAGLRLSRDVVAAVTDPIALGIVVGLFVGKQLGVAASCWVLVRFGWASLPARSTWMQLYGIALLCGIGFTMSLFIAALAFDGGQALERAKVGVLTGSLVSGVVGFLVLRFATGRARR